MVRLVFRSYTWIIRTICTSVSQRTSIRVSSDFILPRYRSPSFGSRQKYYRQIRKMSEDHPLLFCSLLIFQFNTCTFVELLGPCFKTGRSSPQSPPFMTREVTEQSQSWDDYSLLSSTSDSSLIISRLLNLLTEFFSDFPHGTFSLSFSHFTCVGEILLPIRTLLSKRSTRLYRTFSLSSTTGLSPYIEPCPSVSSMSEILTSQNPIF